MKKHSSLLLLFNGVSAGPVNTVAPVISGTPERGQTLTRTLGTWTGTGTITYATQWLRNGAPIAGANGATYILVAADDNANITCRVTATDDEGFTNAISNSLGPVLGAPFNLVAPVVSGTEQVHQILSCTTGTWQGVATITYAYQWQRDGVNIGSATSSTYSLVASDYNTVITCNVTATNGLGSTLQTSNATGLIAGILPSALSVGDWSVAAGDTKATVTISILPAGAVPAIDQIDYRVNGGFWVDSGIGGTGSFDITGLTNGVTYTIEVRAVNAVGAGPDSDDKNVTPAAVPVPVNTVAPVVTGVGYNGQILSSTTGTWTGSPTGYTYQWYSGVSSIPSATNSTYTVTSATEGTSLTCRVTASNGSGSGSPATSNAIHNFVPTDLANTQIWIDASDDSTITSSGGSVSDWNDKSGNSNNYTQGTGSLRPTTGITTINGLNVIQGDNVDNIMVSAINIAANQNIHTILFGRFEAIGVSGGDCNHDYIGAGTIRNFNSWNQNFINNVTNNSNITSLYQPTLGNRISSTSYNNSALTVDLYINGSSTQQTPYPLNVSGTFTGFSSGQTYTSSYILDDSTGGNAWGGWLAEYVVVTGTLSTVNRNKIEGYFAHKWGQLSLLPSNHPHKTNPPTP